MTTEERLAKVERELAETKAQATRVKRRTRWLLVGLAVAVVGLAWTLTKTTLPAYAQAQGAARPIDLEVVYEPEGPITGADGIQHTKFSSTTIYVLWDDGTIKSTVETLAPLSRPRICPDCKGTGRLNTPSGGGRCPTCKGTGKIAP